MSTRFARLAVALSLLALAACDGGPTAPTAPPERGSETFRITNTEMPVRASADGVGAIGNFRVKPAPGDDGAIHLTVGDELTVNANDYRASYPGVTLYLIANWGDGGGNQRVPCGPCRLAHAYDTPGRYTLEMTIDDGIVAPASAMSPATEVVAVIVTAVPEKPAPAPPVVVIPGGRPSATWQSITVACGPLNTTVMMKVTDPDNDASTFTVSLTGGTLTSAPAGGPIPSGGTTTITFTGTPGLSVLRLDLTDSNGLASLPVTRFGPSPTCGGQILQILG